MVTIRSRSTVANRNVEHIENARFSTALSPWQNGYRDAISAFEADYRRTIP
jgi:hypothetical protein